MCLAYFNTEWMVSVADQSVDEFRRGTDDKDDHDDNKHDRSVLVTGGRSRARCRLYRLY